MSDAITSRKVKQSEEPFWTADVFECMGRLLVCTSDTIPGRKVKQSK